MQFGCQDQELPSQITIFVHIQEQDFFTSGLAPAPLQNRPGREFQENQSFDEGLGFFCGFLQAKRVLLGQEYKGLDCSFKDTSLEELILLLLPRYPKLQEKLFGF